MSDSDTDRQIRELRNVLEAFLKNRKPESLWAAKEFIHALDRSKALPAIGCDGNCPACSWGDAQAKEWQNHCLLWSLQETLMDADARAKGVPAAVPKVEALLSALRQHLRPSRT